MEEKELIQQCLKNNRKAQYELFKKFAGKFLGVLVRYIGNKSEAEDVLQEGFIKLFKNIHSFNFSGSFEGWARKIMVNCALDYMRKKKEFVLSFSEVSDSSLIYSQSDQGENDDCKYLKEISTDDLLIMINKLTPGFRVVFNMYVVEGYSHKEISEELGIAVGTSKSNYFRAKEKLRVMLNDYFNKQAK
jgi:RNA polymerase sigma-70 factor (ECF subfamily)